MHQVQELGITCFSKYIVCFSRYSAPSCYPYQQWWCLICKVLSQWRPHGQQDHHKHKDFLMRIEWCAENKYIVFWGLCNSFVYLLKDYLWKSISSFKSQTRSIGRMLWHIKIQVVWDFFFGKYILTETVYGMIYLSIVKTTTCSFKVRI